MEEPAEHEIPKGCHYLKNFMQTASRSQFLHMFGGQTGGENEAIKGDDQESNNSSTKTAVLTLQCWYVLLVSARKIFDS